jgi:hypothetical protein
MGRSEGGGGDGVWGGLGLRLGFRVKVEWKPNTLAYYTESSIVIVKCFIVQAVGPTHICKWYLIEVNQLRENLFVTKIALD